MTTWLIVSLKKMLRIKFIDELFSQMVKNFGFASCHLITSQFACHLLEYKWPSVYAVFLSAIEKWPFPGTYFLIYGNPRSFYVRIHYIRAYFLTPYLSHITRSTCICKLLKKIKMISYVLEV